MHWNQLGVLCIAPEQPQIFGVPWLIAGAQCGLLMWAGTTDGRKLHIVPRLEGYDALAVLGGAAADVAVASASADQQGRVRVLSLAGGGSTRLDVQSGCTTVSALAACMGLIIAGGEDTEVACFRADTGELLRPLLSHAPGVACLATRGSTIAVGCSGRIHTFECEMAGEQPMLTHVLRGDDAAESSALALLDGGVLAAADWFGDIHTWRWYDEPVIGRGRWEPHVTIDALDESTTAEGLGLALAVCRGHFLASAYRFEEAVKLWNVRDGSAIMRLATPDGVKCLQCVGDILICACADGAVCFWRKQHCAAAVDHGTQLATSGEAGDNGDDTGGTSRTDSMTTRR